MNKRIRELMIEAGYAAPELAGRANKLVELIIQECAKFVDENTEIDKYGEIEKIAYGSDLINYFRAENEESNSMKPCPFCAHKVDLENEDTLYPNGSGWIDREEGFRSYHRFNEVPKEQWCWSMHCPTTAGGCGIELSGDSKQECIDAWNKRV